MRVLLRYLKSDMRVALWLPCNSEILEAKGVQGPHLVAFSDASLKNQKKTEKTKKPRENKKTIKPIKAKKQ